MASTINDSSARPTTPRRAALAASVGATVEMYDFTIYGTAAALVFNQLFFPNFDPLVGSLLAFATFGAGFVARLFGSAVIGHFGDRIGRKSMLIVTVVAMGAATFLIGFLPTYASVGLWAPLLLVTLRVVQGFFFGGEHGGAMLVAVEHAPAARRGFFGSFSMMGSPLGVALATAVMVLTIGLSGDQFLVWGWRIPFLASIVIIAVGLYLRAGLTETPEFSRAQRHEGVATRPLVDAVQRSWRTILLVAGIIFCATMFTYLLVVFLLTYITANLGLSQSLGLYGSILGSLVMAACMVLGGWWSDRVGRRRVLTGGAIFVGLYAFPFFWLMDLGTTGWVVLAMLIGYAGTGVFWGPAAAFLADLFRTRVRYSGVSLGYQLGAVFGGGLTPFVATALLERSGGQSWPISLYIIGTSLVALTSLALLGQGGRAISHEPTSRPASVEGVGGP